MAGGRAVPIAEVEVNMTSIYKRLAKWPAEEVYIVRVEVGRLRRVKGEAQQPPTV